MSTDEIRDIRAILHEELEERDKELTKIFESKLKSTSDPPLLKYLPIISIAVAVIIWGVRLEGRMDNQVERFDGQVTVLTTLLEAHERKQWHDGMRETTATLAEIKTEIKYLRQQVSDLEKKITP